MVTGETQQDSGFNGSLGCLGGLRTFPTGYHLICPITLIPEKTRQTESLHPLVQGMAR
jgi:hypothetical protein